MAEPFTIYKLTILDILDKTDTPLNNTQISKFFLELDYTDFFNVQFALGDLQDADLIRAETSHKSILYSITAAGRETLALLHDKLNDGIDDDITSFLQKNGVKIRSDNAVLADYYKTPNGDYAIRCRYREKQRNLLELTLHAAGKEQAETICENWKNRFSEAYAGLMDLLV